jgi:hypothetical protein
VFFAVEGARIVLLLSGYDKGANPSEKRQGREIKLERTPAQGTQRATAAGPLTSADLPLKDPTILDDP